MTKPESLGVGLLPIVVAAGLLSGGLFRQTPAPEPAKMAVKPAEQLREEIRLTGPWLSDLRPVMETIGDAMGLPIQRDQASRTSDVTAANLHNISVERVTAAIARVHAALERRMSGQSGECDVDDLTSDEQTLNGYLLSAPDDEDPKSSSRKLLTTVAEASLNQLRDWRSFLALTKRARRQTGESAARYDVTFIVATVPDYVDSNAGWFADQSLTAIQAAMSRSAYLLDRFRLIDWTRTDPRTDNPVANDSRLHERQPGALIFRDSQKRDGDTSSSVDGKRVVHLRVVLLALETPTSGMHRSALRNAIKFIRAWHTCSGDDKEGLDVLGPTFSGSTLSMALTLGDPDDRFAGAFKRTRVITGSASADDNLETFQRFAPSAEFHATVQPTLKTLPVMAAFLEGMNSSWRCGTHVAILRESNTAYGQAADRQALKKSKGLSPVQGSTRRPDDCKPLAEAEVFAFPLHVSQLRSDSPETTRDTVTVLPSPAIPLNMRETTPPADQIPALRPQLTSPVVNATVDTILDTIRHERLTAVGIQATDDRDVLFLAREVKRAVPDVQLFLIGAHALYLHQDYIPYLRGTLVASTYPLSLTAQSRATSDPHTREPFQSWAAEGLFNATLLLMDSKSALRDYCDPSTVGDQQDRHLESITQCVPRVSVSVIGEDGFWPLPGDHAQGTDNAGYVQPAGTPEDFSPIPLPPLPTQARIVFTVVGLFVLAQVLMLLFMRHRLRKGERPGTFLKWPVLRVLAPPMTHKTAARLHRISLVICFAVLAAISAWVTVVLTPFLLSSPSGVLVGVTLVTIGVMLPALLPRTSREAQHVYWGPEAARRRTRWLLSPVIALLALGLCAFIVYLVGLVSGDTPADVQLTLARLVGGGIISPATATLCLFAALYAGIFGGMRRLSLVGWGYAQLEKKSRAFDLLNRPPTWSPNDRRPQACARLSDVLDMPAQNLPVSYTAGILLVLVVAVLSIGGISTIEGKAFTWFFGATSATVLMLGLLNLAQGLTIWNTARAHLKWLAQSPIEGSFTAIANLVPWNLSLTPPRLMELLPVARRADQIALEFRVLRDRTEVSGCGRSRIDDEPRGEPLDQDDRVETKLTIRKRDFGGIGRNVAVASHVSSLEQEIVEQQHAPFTQSSSWMRLWEVSDAIVLLLQRTAWCRLVPNRQSAPPSGIPVATTVGGPTDVGQADIAISQRMRMAAALELDSDSIRHRNMAHEHAGLLRRCEELIALQFGFVLRDIVARTIAALFTAMLCLMFLTAAHLLYSFNGRSAMLTVDLLAVAGASLASIWILVGMERETVLSRLRNTTPGQLDINWAFVQRVAVYGVLPLLVVIASVFPEIGNSIFGWLEPLRKLSSV
ncbi:MAG TPA: hypothetical protein VGF24_06730 [Vicinamibacterales bacterium]|jgi:hypothetical protein